MGSARSHQAEDSVTTSSRAQTARTETGLAGPHQLRRLFEAVLLVGGDLSLPETLNRFAEAAASLAGAQYSALGVLDHTRTALAEFVVTGLDEAEQAAIGERPKGHGLLGTLINDPKPLRSANLNQHPDRFGFPPNHPPMTSFLGVPVLIRGEVFGNLYLCNKLDADEFTDADEEVIVALAAAAGVAIDNARLHARVADLALLEDRDRIARDLHDTVIQRLFAVGLGLQNTHRLASDPEIQARIDAAVDDVDLAIHELRSAIFELHAPQLPGRSVRTAALSVSAEASRTLGFEPSVHFAGPVDAAIDDAVAPHLLAVLREALANVAKHADASHVDLTLSATNQTIELRVVDNGRGPGSIALGGNGIDNMTARARQLGGRCEVTPGPSGGTVVSWSVPAG